MPVPSPDPTRFFITELELKELAEEYEVPVRDICRVCGKKITVMIYRGSGVCSDDHRKIRDGDDPSPYPFRGHGTTGAP